MMYKKSPFIMMFLLTSLFLNACQSSPSIGKCISPLDRWEFPIGAKSTKNFYEQIKESPPSGSWTVESTLPNDDQIFNIATHSSDEIWLATEEKLLRYLPDSYTWDEFSMIGDQKLSPRGLYESEAGTLWGFNLSTNEFTDTEQKLSTLIRYNENGQFEVVSDRDLIFNNGMAVWGLTEPANNPDGLLWMLGEEDINDNEYLESLISFNPTTLQAVRYFSQVIHHRAPATPESGFSDIAIPPDGNIWIVDRGLGKLVYFNPSTKLFDNYDAHLSALLGLSSELLRDNIYLYVDRKGRLWIDDKGYLDFSDPQNPQWHKVIRSLVFFSDSIAPEHPYGWSRSYQMYQSSDGMYWFSASVGMMKLDPDTGKWCKFTNRSSPIAEDSQGNLWIAVFGKLYRNHIAP